MDNKTRIFHVIESGDLGGSGRTLADICNRLDPSKFDITVVYAVRQSSSPQEFESIFNGNVRKIYLPEMVRSPNPRKDLIAFIRLFNLFRKYKPDIVHGHSSKGGFLARFAALFAGIPKIFYTAYGYSFRMTDITLISKAIYYFLEAIASPIGFVVVNSPNELDAASRLARRGRVLPYYGGFDISGYTPAYPGHTNAPTIAACGRITPARIPSAFARLCSRIEKQYSEVTFVWIGSGNVKDVEAFQKYVGQLGITRLRITGWQGPSGVIQELGRADVFIHYSSWDALPRAVFEAMALGKPVVGSTAVDQIIHSKNGFVAKSEDELFDYTCQLLNSWELRNKMGREARRTVEENYSLGRLIRQLEAAYLDLNA